MKSHFIDTHMLVPRSKSFEKFQILRSHFSKMPFSGALVFHKHSLFPFYSIKDRNHLSSFSFLVCRCFYLAQSKTLSFGRVNKPYKLVPEYVFIIQRVIHHVKGDNSKCIFFFFSRISPFFNLDFLSSVKHPTAKCWHLYALLLVFFFFLIFSLNPFPNKPWFFHVCSTSLLKTLWEKEKLLIVSNSFFSHSVFYPFGELSAIFIKFKIVGCKLFQFGRV